MILALLHLSDIHLKGSRSANVAARIPQIVAAVRSAHPLIDHCLLIISGDVAFSGKLEEYQKADKLLRELQSELSKHFALHPTIVVPGNHDCDFKDESDVRRLILESLNSTTQIDQVEFDHKVSGSLKLEGPWLIRDDAIDVGDEHIQIVRLNTAFMSQLHEQQGSLSFPNKIAAKYLNRQFDASLVLSVFHHPYGWLESGNANSLKRLVESGTDVVLTGHEHVQSSFTKELINGQRLEYIEGAVLEAEGQPESGFNVVVCDLSKKQKKTVQFQWRKDRYSTSEDGAWKPFLRNDALRRLFDKNPAFSEYLAAVGTGFIHPRKSDLKLTDIFVYPDLQRLSFEKGAARRDISLLVPSAEVPDFIREKTQLLMIGLDHSGRSALSRKIFTDLDERGIVPILLKGKEVKAKTVDAFVRAVNDAFVEQYSRDALEAFKQLPPERKALIFDDWHYGRFPRGAMKDVIDAAARIFGKVIVIAGDILRIEEIAAQKDKANPFLNFDMCEIRQFSNVLRGRLIEKWISLDRDVPIDDPDLAREIDQAEKTVRTLLGKRLLPSYPFIILMLLQATETSKDTSSPSGSYGYLYEFIITKAIANVSKDLTLVDLKYVVLSRLSYYLFERDKKRFTRLDMQRVVEEYRNEYDISLNADELLKEFDKAGLLATANGNFEFRYRYAYYYFVARYIRDAMRSPGRREEFENKLQDMADRVYYDEYMNILMFVVYLTKDEELINYVLRKADQIYGESEPCDFESHVEFVNKLYTERPKLILPSGSYEEAREKQREGLDQAEIGEIDSTDPEGKNVTYSESLADIIKLNISFKTLQLMGQILRNFPGSLDKDVKLRLTRSCYLLGLRSFRAIMAIAETNLEDFRKYVAEIIKEYKPIVSEEELARTADEAVLWLTRRCAFAVMKRISYSVGLEILAETYKRVRESAEVPVAFNIIDLTVKLDHFKAFPADEVEEAWTEARKNYFLQMVVRDLVGYHLYLVPIDDRTKQSVCQLLDIKFQRRLPAG